MNNAAYPKSLSQFGLTWPALGWRFVCIVALLAAMPAAAETRLVKPFIQQIALTDFQLLETNNDLVLSPSHQLVLCFTTFGPAGTINRVVALRQRARDGYVLTYRSATTGVAHSETREVELAPEIARNVLACFRDVMTHSLLPPSRALHEPTRNDDVWIFVRTAGNQTLTGTALNSALQSPGDYGNVTIYRDLCAGLVGVFVYPEERNALLKQLDRFAAVYVRTNGLAAR